MYIKEFTLMTSFNSGSMVEMAIVFPYFILSSYSFLAYYFSLILNY